MDMMVKVAQKLVLDINIMHCKITTALVVIHPGALVTILTVHMVKFPTVNVVLKVRATWEMTGETQFLSPTTNGNYYFDRQCHICGRMESGS
eukprot:UN23661